MRVRCRGIFQVCERITPQSIGATLEKNEFGLEAHQMLFHSRPDFTEFPVAGRRF